MENNMLVFVMKYAILLTFCVNLSFQCNLSDKEFPESFKFGVATAAYQIEGAWNLNGKGESIWDRYTHAHPEKIVDRSTGDVACDAYHKTKVDVTLIKDLGVSFYRFSLSWTRILPTGFTNRINPDGIRYYNELIDQLLANGIEPMITLYHWDLPQSLQELGGFTNRLIVEHFENYARVAFEHFGDRVKSWLTFNEPKMVCKMAYGAVNFAPGWENSTGVGDYLCAHNLLLAHAKAYHVYDKEFRPQQKGKIAITLDTDWYEPNNIHSEEDQGAVKRSLEFSIGWFANPIFSKEGDYPETMKRRIAERSAKEGFPKSRLPEFTKEEIRTLIGTSDFFGFNHYTSVIVTSDTDASVDQFSYANDLNVKSWKNASWPTSGIAWLRVYPKGFRKIMKYIKETYHSPDLFITENGYAGFPDEGTNDPARIIYYKKYLSAVLDAIHEDGVNVVAYAAWSLMDDFEWDTGYTVRFGLYHVDFNDPNRPRKAKKSAKFYKQLVKDRRLPLSDGTCKHEEMEAQRADDDKEYAKNDASCNNDNNINVNKLISLIIALCIVGARTIID